MCICMCPCAVVCVQQVSHNFAINATRNAGFFPVTVSADDPENLSNKNISNYDKVLVHYFVNYCLAESLEVTSKEAREV